MTAICSHTPCAICDREIARLQAELAITATALNVANHALGLAAPKVHALTARIAELEATLLSAASPASQSRIRTLEAERDSLDCSLREGAGVYHCPAGAKCQACLLRALEAALRPFAASICGLFDQEEI